MILIYSHKNSPRLQYVAGFIFKELLGVEVEIVTDVDHFKNVESVKINYSNEPIDAVFSIQPCYLLFENNIQQQKIKCFEHNGNKAFFKTESGDYPFDIFAATFYLISRYEEYLPHEKDEYGRYGHTNSLAFNQNFLQLPLVNIWVNEFAEILKGKFSTLNFELSTFNFQPTYDIDMAFSYKHKSLVRNTGGFLRSPSWERIAVLLGSKKDPFDSYDWMDKLHEENALKPIYFFLVAAKNGKYDKNILLHKNIMHKLTRHYAKKYSIGLHPSWQSGDMPSLLQKEKEHLEIMSDSKITSSRQHYIRFSLSETYQRLIGTGITDDYSMGYGTINGFRASVASPFYWYDLQKEEKTSLRIHPFCFMDANSFYEQHLSAEQAYEELMQYYTICKKVHGTLITIWHNNFLGTGATFEGWKEMYERFILQLQQ